MCPKMSRYLLDELREVLSDDGEGFAIHSEVITLLLLRNLLVIYHCLHVYLHHLTDRDESQTGFTKILNNN